jgi:hypothetical protein
MELSAQDISDVGEAILAVTRTAGFSNDHTRTVLAAIAEVQSYSGKMNCYAASLGARLNNSLEPYASREELERCGKSNTQRWRRSFANLDKDQKKTGFVFVEYFPGSRDERGTNRPSTIKVDCKTFAETIRLARQSDHYEGLSRRYAFEEAAREVLSTKAKVNVFRPQREKLSEAQKVSRNEKTFTRVVRRIAENAITQGLEASLEDLEELVIRQATDQIRLAFCLANLDKKSSSNLPNETWSEGVRQDEIDTVLDIQVSTASLETRSTRGGLEDSPGCVPDSLAAVEAFESVGVTSFDVTLKDEVTAASDFDKGVNSDDLRKSLPGYLERNRSTPESFIIRPRGGSLIQVDDLDAKKLSLIESFSFLTIETSPNNFQAWLALPENTDEETRKAIRSRLVSKIESDKGASGAVRCPGSFNRKPSRNGCLVRLRSSSFGRLVTTEELENAELLTPPKPNLETKATSRNIRPRTCRSFPSYERCLMDKQGDESAADASFLKISTLRGFSYGEAYDELRQVAKRDKLERRDYYTRTENLITN